METAGEPQSLVEYFLQSKKALAHGQSLCAHASDLNSATASTAVEALAFEAKGQWMNEAIIEQLNVRNTSHLLS